MSVDFYFQGTVFEDQFVQAASKYGCAVRKDVNGATDRYYPIGFDYDPVGQWAWVLLNEDDKTVCMITRFAGNEPLWLPRVSVDLNVGLISEFDLYPELLEEAQE